MDYRNLTTDELVREAEAQDNQLALALSLAHEVELEEREEEVDEVLEEVIEYHADKVEKAIEQYNEEYYLNPESDYADCLIECLRDQIDGDSVCRLIEELDRDMDRAKEPFPIGREPITENAMAYLNNLRDDQVQDLAEAIWFMEGFTVEIGNMMRPIPYAIAGHVIGEQEEDLEHWVEELPESIQQKVMDKVTGQTGGTLFYIDNSDQTVDLVVDLNFLESWVEEQQYNEALEA